MKSYAQHKQDLWVVNHFKGKRNGIYVDIGAHDGITLSNTYLLEKEYGWTGIVIEPLPHQWQRLIDNRPNSIPFNIAIYDKVGEENFLLVDHDGYPDMLSGIQKDMGIRQMSDLLKESTKRRMIKVPTQPLKDILLEANIHYVDYLSIDVEGAELKVLQSIDFNKVFIDIIMFENGGKSNHIRDYLKEKGYEHITSLFPDDVFKRNKIVEHTDPWDCDGPPPKDPNDLFYNEPL